jgi:superfamily II DNA/RNA helicase
MMFSATFNKEFRKLAKDYLSDDHVRLRVGRAGSVHRNVVQEVCRPVNMSNSINADKRTYCRLFGPIKTRK